MPIPSLKDGYMQAEVAEAEAFGAMEGAEAGATGIMPLASRIGSEPHMACLPGAALQSTPLTRLHIQVRIRNRNFRIFPELCHGCAGCWLVCPEKAIQESSRTVGVIEDGDADGGVRFMHGELRIGEAHAVPLIRELKQRMPADGVIIIDAPPGTSCKEAFISLWERIKEGGRK